MERNRRNIWNHNDREPPKLPSESKAHIQEAERTLSEIIPESRVLLCAVCILSGCVVLRQQNWLAATENWFTNWILWYKIKNTKVFTIWLFAENNGYSKLMKILQSKMASFFSCWWMRALNRGECSGQDGDRWQEGYFDFQRRRFRFYLVAVTCLGCMPVSSAPSKLLELLLSELPLQRAVL